MLCLDRLTGKNPFAIKIQDRISDNISAATFNKLSVKNANMQVKTVKSKNKIIPITIEKSAAIRTAAAAISFESFASMSYDGDDKFVNVSIAVLIISAIITRAIENSNTMYSSLDRL